MPKSIAAIWIIEEPEFFFQSKTELDVADIRHPKRRIEHIAGRFLLRELQRDFPLERIEKDIHGKPQLPGWKGSFSVSHSYPYVMAAWSEEFGIGVDIQIPHPHIENLAHKFLSTEEQHLLQQDVDLFNLAWTAKEAAYKLQGLRGVDFKQHLPIQTFDTNLDTYHMRIECTLPDPSRIAEIISLKANEFCYSIAVFEQY